MTVSELLDRMSSAEMTEWVALVQIEAEESKQSRQMASNRSRVRR